MTVSTELSESTIMNQNKLKQFVEVSCDDIGSQIVSFSDEFFAEANNLLKRHPAIHKPDTFTSNGAWMDGWETKRHNKEDFDWVIIKLAFPSNIYAFDVDTSYFTGNYAPAFSIDTCYLQVDDNEESSFQPQLNEGGKAKKRKVNKKKSELSNLSFTWKELVPKTKLIGTSHNYIFLENNSEKVNFIRLKNYPDGGIARFRVYGKIVPEPIKEGEVRDLAFVGNGGNVVHVSDEHYGPGLGVNMGDGWETKRSREPDHSDHVIIKLGVKGKIQNFEIYTTHFKGNYPQYIQLWGANSNQLIPDSSSSWAQLTEKIEGKPHEILTPEILSESKMKSFTHVKLVIFPDGGISRIRVFGTPDQS